MDKGRDLKVSILSDADRFNLAAPADDLERLGDAAGDTARDLEDLGSTGLDRDLDRTGAAAQAAGDDLERLGNVDRDLDRLGAAARSAGDDLEDVSRKSSDLDRVEKDAKGAGAGLDHLGDDATAAAKRVDSAMDKIAASSKRSASQVDSSMDRASGSLDEFKDEARQSGTEAAASFSGGFDSVTGFVQETLAAGLSSVGKVGMAAGIAAAAGIGFVVSAAQAASEKVDGIRQSLLDLKTEGLDDTASRIRAVLDEMRETGTLERFAGAAKDAGIDWQEYVRALAMGGPEADRMREKLEAITGAYGGLATIAGPGSAAHDLVNRLGDQEKAAAGAALEFEALSGATAGLPDAQAETSVAVEGLTSALESFVDPANTYTTLLADAEQAERDRAAATAKGTKDSTDDWTDYAKAVDVSVDDYISSLEDQVAAQEKWAANLATLAKRGVSEGTLAELERLGPEGAPLVAKLTKASDAELDRLVAVMRRKGADSTDQLAAGLRAGKPGVAGEVQDVRDDMKRRLSGRIDVPVGVDGPSSGDLAAMRRQIYNSLSGITVSVNAVAQAALGRSVP